MNLLQIPMKRLVQTHHEIIQTISNSMKISINSIVNQKSSLQFTRIAIELRA